MKTWIIIRSDGWFYKPAGFVQGRVDAHRFDLYRKARMVRDKLMRGSAGETYQIQPTGTAR